MKEGNTQDNFHSQLRTKVDAYVEKVYDVSSYFPKDELYGVTSQLRRSTLSIALNYIEGFARQRKLVLKNFLEMAYGSLKESRYLLEFSAKRRYIKKEEAKLLLEMNDELGKMIWGILTKL